MFTPPDRFEKHTLLPKESRLIAQGDALTWEQGARRRETRLADFPQAAPLIESLRATLLGDRATLERFFQPTLQGDLQRWDLTLTPRTAKSGGQIESIVLRGEQTKLLSLDLRERGGDHTEMTFGP